MSRKRWLAGVLVALATSAVLWRASRPSSNAMNGAKGPAPTADAPVDTPPVDAGVEASPTQPRPRRPDDELPQKLSAQRERIYQRMLEELGVDDTQLAKLREIIEKTRVISEGNPEVTRHPMTRSACFEIRERAGLHSDRTLEVERQNAATCGAKNMVPMSSKGDAGPPEVCIDQYEFPSIPCEYPLVYASAQEASQLCHAVGKRLCDAHEWEGACAGELLPAEAEYLWDRPRRIEMEFFKNEKRQKVWAYGPTKDHKKCGTGSRKSSKCEGGGWETCGSNTYPAGAFPECVSRFGVYDQHGNAAEHMNLPMNAKELGQNGGLGETEMKGSWFIFERGEAHEDDCRWRAPAWHATRVDYWNSHRNYHLGFRCCKAPGPPL